MPLAGKEVRGKGRQPLSPPQHTEAPERDSAPVYTRPEITPLNWIIRVS